MYVLHIFNIKDLKATKRDRKKANKQDIRYYSIDSIGQDNNYSVTIIITSAKNPYFNSLYSYTDQMLLDVMRNIIKCS